MIKKTFSLLALTFFYHTFSFAAYSCSLMAIACSHCTWSEVLPLHGLNIDQRYISAYDNLKNRLSTTEWEAMLLNFRGVNIELRDEKECERRQAERDQQDRRHLSELIEQRKIQEAQVLRTISEDIYRFPEIYFSAPSGTPLPEFDLRPLDVQALHNSFYNNEIKNGILGKSWTHKDFVNKDFQFIYDPANASGYVIVIPPAAIKINVEKGSSKHVITNLVRFDITPAPGEIHPQRFVYIDPHSPRFTSPKSREFIQNLIDSGWNRDLHIYLPLTSLVPAPEKQSVYWESYKGISSDDINDLRPAELQTIAGSLISEMFAKNMMIYDLKPANILLVRSTDKPIKVTRIDETTETATADYLDQTFVPIIKAAAHRGEGIIHALRSRGHALNNADEFITTMAELSHYDERITMDVLRSSLDYAKGLIHRELEISENNKFTRHLESGILEWKKSFDAHFVPPAARYIQSLYWKCKEAEIARKSAAATTAIDTAATGASVCERPSNLL